MAFWPFWQPSSNKLAIFIISCIILSMLFVENKFFFFYLLLFLQLLQRLSLSLTRLVIKPLPLFCTLPPLQLQLLLLRAFVLPPFCHQHHTECRKCDTLLLAHDTAYRSNKTRAPNELVGV